MRYEARAPRATDERELLDALRAGDEAVFSDALGRFHPALLRLARTYVHCEADAEELARCAWLVALERLETDLPDAPLRSWLLGLVAELAPDSPVAESGRGTCVDPERFDESGHWRSGPRRWNGNAARDPETALACVRAAVERLPAAERRAVLLRDVEHLGRDDVCRILGIEDAELLALLALGRARVREALETTLGAAA